MFVPLLQNLLPLDPCFGTNQSGVRANLGTWGTAKINGSLDSGIWITFLILFVIQM